MRKVLTLKIPTLTPNELRSLESAVDARGETEQLLQTITQHEWICRCGSAYYEDADGDLSCPFCMSGCFDDDELLLTQIREAERQTIIATLLALDKAMSDGLHTWHFTKALGDYEP